MDYRSKTPCIALSLATLFVLLGPVVGGGFAFDSASCDASTIEFLTFEMRRAVTIAHNSGRYLTRGPLETLPVDVSGPLKLIMDPFERFIPQNHQADMAKAVFSGGELWHSDPMAPRQYVPGIESYSQTLPNFDSSNNQASNPADETGNVVISAADPEGAILAFPHTLILDSSFSATTIVSDRQDWIKPRINSKRLIVMVHS